MACADDDTLARLLDGKLAESDRIALERHCGDCARCATIFGELGAATNQDTLLGREIGRYRVVRVVGEGGMGRVYEAVHTELGTRVALKVMASDQAGLAQRFLTEARAASTVRHDRIARVLDLFRTEDGRAVIVMDLVEGKTLRAHERAERLSTDFVVKVMIDVLDGIAAAHALGITHRDLKPDNIVIEPGGRAKVLDFGIAKVAHDTAGVTRTGAVIGTPEYMSPEQISGGAIDARSDLYSAGVVLYEALAGERPYAGTNDFAIMRAHLDAPIPHVRDIPAALDAVITRALAKDPADRFPDAAAMARALASPPGKPRSRRGVIGAACVAATIVVGWKLLPTTTKPTVQPVAVAPPPPPILIDAYVADAAPPDAAAVRKLAPLDPTCRCIVDESNPRFAKRWLCTSHRAPMCKCQVDITNALCPTPLEKCPNNVCDDFAVDFNSTKYRCSIGVPGKWWAANRTQGSACRGYDRPDGRERAGVWACSICERFDTFRATPGQECRGTTESGVELAGHIVCHAP